MEYCYWFIVIDTLSDIIGPLSRLNIMNNHRHYFHAGDLSVNNYVREINVRE